MQIIEASGMQLYNGTNKIYSDPKGIRKYLEKKLKPNGRVKSITRKAKV